MSIKIKKTEISVFAAENGLEITTSTKMNPDTGLNETTVTATLGSASIEEVGLGFLIQAAEVAKKADRRGKFVCASHGSFISYDRAQPPSCPSCANRAVSSIRESVAEEADA